MSPEGQHALGPDPKNYLLDQELNIKVEDFEFSRDFTNYKLTAVSGTFSYRSTEMLECKVYNVPKVDFWSLGVILYRMVTEKLPFVGKNFGELKQHTLNG